MDTDYTFECRAPKGTPPLPRTFRQTGEQWRTLRGSLSLERVAQRSGLFMSIIAEIEQGVRKPSDKEAAILLRIYRGS